jgi:preprotein translocase subunit SecF
VALIHDALIVLGVFSLFQFEVNVPFVAAILTVLGYSVNDTIINFDRIRENIKLYPRMDLIPLVNKSIVQVLSRTINTAGTTLVTVFAVLIFGGPTLKTFMLALAIGFFSGIYSSWFVASPVVVIFDLLAQRAAAAQKTAGGVTPRKPSRPPVEEALPQETASAPKDKVPAAGPRESRETVSPRKRGERKKKPRRR